MHARRTGIAAAYETVRDRGLCSVYGIRTLTITSLLVGASVAGCMALRGDHGTYGLDSRVVPPPFLHMPHEAAGAMPSLLSQTGAFKDTRTLTPADGLIPYDVRISFWSDGAQKLRWVSVPNEKIGFAPTGEWTFPNGVVFVKTFELPVDESNTAVKRRLETRLLVRDSAGGVYGVVYKWRADNSDADLLSSSLTERIPIRTASGKTRYQTWYYPSREDCLKCHNEQAGGVLGLKTRQMNRDITYPSGVTDNQLRTWNHLGLFSTRLDEAKIPSYPTLAAVNDTTRSLEDRARSYLDANCSQCHRPGVTAANFDARYDTLPAKQAIVDGPVLIDERIDHSRVIAPHDIWRSILFMRVETEGGTQMPPLARMTIDTKGVALLKQWIQSMPGKAVVPPPRVSPGGGNFRSALEVSMTDTEPDAEIHYTLDGSTPEASDPRYEKPITVSQTMIVRARAYKKGYTRSIVSQGLFVIGQ